MIEERTKNNNENKESSNVKRNSETNQQQHLDKLFVYSRVHLPQITITTIIIIIEKYAW